MKLHIAICDDEPVFCKEIKKKILEVRPEYETDIFFSGKELLEASTYYDMVFLDIEMPEQNGIETARILYERKCMGYIIFLTNYVEYMADAFKVKAFRYLTKPIKMADLDEAIKNAERELFDCEKMVVDGYGSGFVINMKEIVYIEAAKKITILHLVNQDIEIPHPLKYWLEKLPEEEFCQVHKSFIVSLNYIIQIDTYEILLKESSLRIPLSRRRHSLVRQKFFDYIKRHAVII